MRPTADNEARTVTSTLAGEDVKMRIHEGATQHIMGILSNQLYEDPELAIIREISTNAADAHVAAGTERQIEVSTPTELKPVLTITDYGIGMTPDDIREVYSAYGASTKRETDDQTGMLGLGCKSPFAYTDQFTVISVKDGERTTVSVSRDEQGAGVMKIISLEPTDDAPGTTVSIPAKRVNDIENKAKDFFRFWRPGSILLDGADPPALGGFELTDGLHVINSDGYESDVIVMGNVPYPATLKCVSRGYKLNTVAFVPMGAVHFTPSREGLQDTAQTRETIEDIKARFDLARDAAMAEAMESAGSRSEALQSYLEIRARLFVGRRAPDAKYLGHPVPRQFKYAGKPQVRMVPAIAPSYKASENFETTEVDATKALDNPIWVLNFNNRTFTKSMRAKLDGHCQRLGISYTGGFILTPRSYVPMREWFGQARSMEWEDVKAFKLPNTGVGSVSTGPSMVGHYEGYDADGTYHERIPVTDLNDGRKLFHTSSGASHYHEFLPKGATITQVPGNRDEKYRRLLPQSVSIHTYLREEGPKVWAAASEELREAYQYQVPYGLGSLRILDPKAVLDPALAREARLYQAATDSNLEGLERWSAYLGVKRGGRLNYYNDRMPKACTPYPLLRTDEATDCPTEHLTLYVNAVYAANREEVK